MTEVRTTSRTGGEKGVKPERHSLIPKEALDSAARVYAFGAGKYADHNWRKRYEWSKSYDAAIRHLTAFWSGETFDPESGESHLGHAMFHLFALQTWLTQDGEGSEFDDRYKAPVEVDEDASFDLLDLTTLQAKINEDIRRIADAMRTPEYFIQRPTLTRLTACCEIPTHINDAHNGPGARG